MAFDLEKLEDSEYLLDILISVENILDSLDVYVYRNWFDGEIIEGPIVRRHWVTVSLLYPYNKMPDPRAALRLLKHGVQVEFDNVKQQQEPGPEAVPGQLDVEPAEDTHWIVKIIIPRRLLDQIDGVDLAMYDDEVNPDDVTAAKDIGLDDESPYQSDEQLPDQNMQPPLPGEQPLPPPQGQPNAQQPF